MNNALIVDDSRTSAAVLGKMLARHQLISDKVASGEECLAYLVSSIPDVIFMDHMMPGMDGFQAVKAIKTQPELCHIPIIMYTSKEGEIYSGQARALGASGVIQKPAAEQDVAELLGRLRSDRERYQTGVQAANDAGVEAATGQGAAAPSLPSWLSAGAGSRAASRISPPTPKLHRALIVDDSRTSAAMLAKMLMRKEVGSDKVNSGEECLTYLASANPDVIFMDHMMPGMDGFETIKAIKQQTKLRAIPIVMFTSRSGDQYIGQARALGAVGVLKKPATEQELADILDRLKRETSPGPAALKTPELSVPAPTRRPAQISDAHTRLQTPAAGPVSSTPVRRSRWPRRALAGGILLLISLMVGVLAGGSRIDPEGMVEALGRLGNQHQAVAFGALPFDDQRYEVLHNVVSVLSHAGIGANIELRSHVGEFCRVYAGGDRTRLPAGDTPIEQCDMVGYEPGEARQLAASQSPRFRAFMERLPELAPAIRVHISPVGIYEPLLPYPPDNAITMAGDWNKIAARNNRVEMWIRLDGAKVSD